LNLVVVSGNNPISYSGIWQCIVTNFIHGCWFLHVWCWGNANLHGFWSVHLL